VSSEKKGGMNYLILLVGLTAVSFSPTCNTILMGHMKYSGVQIGASRLLLGAFGLLLFPALWRSRKEIIENFRPLFLGGLMLAAHFFFWTSAFEYVELSSAVIFLAAQPLISLMVTFKVKSERVSLALLICSFVTAAGLFLIFREDLELSEDSMIGNIYVIVCGFCIVFYQLMTRKVNEKLPWITFNFSVWFFGGLSLLVVAILQGLYRQQDFWLPLQTPEGETWQGALALAGLVFLSTYAGHGCYNRVIPHLKLFIVNLTMVAQPVVALTLGICLGLDKMPSGLRLLGSLIAIGGMALGLFLDYRSKQKLNVEEAKDKT
jgi:drug/metabolite transporter (DMT)-like permease